MKDTASPDQESGGPVPLAHKSDITGMGLGPPFMGSHVQDPSGYLRRSLGLPGATLHPPFHLAALTSPVYPPSLLGAGFPPASIMASLSGPRGNAPMPPPLVPTSRGAALTNLHTTLATGHASRHADLLALLKDSARQQELLLALSKLSPSPSSSRSSSSSLPRGQYPSPPSPPPAQRLHEASPRRRSSERSSSASPSSYLTPRSLNGDSTPSNFSPRIFALSNLSPTSPPMREDSLAVPPRPPSTGRRASSSSAPRPDRVFTCRTCNRSFGYKHVLQNHERTHTGEKPFECPQCHKRFTRDHHLKTHMRLHTGEKPYHCTHCDRQFVQVANLRRHLRVHTGERPYSCETCPSRFSDSNQLKAHSLIHKGEKPYGCHGCRASFRRRHHLIQHKCAVEGAGSPGGSILPEEEAGFGYPGGELFPSDDVDDDELTDEGGASPMGTPIPSTMTVLMEEEEEEGTALVQERRRGRKSKEPRRLVANSTLLHSPALKDHLLRPTLPPTPLPEQTEPEDLSMSGSRNRREASHTYHANIALTTSSPTAGCPSYPMPYGSMDSATKDDEQELLVNSYRAGDLKPLGFNS